MEMARHVVIMLAALILASLVLSVRDRAAAADTPSLGLDVHFDEPTIRQSTVTDKQNGSVNFTGVVRVDWFCCRVFVNLAATVDIGWECVITPNLMVLPDTIDHPFSVTVTVPEATRADTVGNVKVMATADDDGLSATDEANATVTVAPYYLLTIVSDDPYREILPQESTSFTMKIQNHGNAIDSYELRIANARELEDAGWSVKLSNSTINGVPPEGEMKVSVTVRSLQGLNWIIWISRTTPIILRADSLGATNNNMTLTQTLPVHVHVEGYNNPLLELLTTISVLTAVGVTIIAIARWRQKKGR
jgi:hypothetical protein